MDFQNIEEKDVYFWLFVIVIIGIFYFNQKKPPEECTDEYIKVFGGSDCQSYREMRDEYQQDNSYFGN